MGETSQKITFTLEVREELQLLSYTPISSNTVQKSGLPVVVVDIPVFMGFYTSQVVQDLFHQHYLKTRGTPCWTSRVDSPRWFIEKKLRTTIFDFWRQGKSRSMRKKAYWITGQCITSTWSSFLGKHPHFHRDFQWGRHGPILFCLTHWPEEPR